MNPSFLKILFPWILWKGSKKSPNVYLTFDDGPHPQYTKQVLACLKQHQAKASFFLQGEKVLLYPGIVEQMKREGHTIGNHGFSHESLFLKQKNKITTEIERTNQAIEKITGQKPIFFRPPYGRFDPRFRKIMQTFNLRCVTWSLLPLDYKQTNPDTIIRIIKFRLHPGVIIVLHDGHKNTPVMLKALPDILKMLHNKGYRCRPLEQLQENSR